MSHDIESNPATQTPSTMSTEELRERAYPNNPNRNTFFDRHLNTRLKKFAAITALGATLAGGGIAGGMYAESSRAEKAPAATEAPAVPGAVETASVPAEAKSFMDLYGSRYSDPIATYYAEKAYMQTEGGLWSTLDDNWVKTYQSGDSITSPKSALYNIEFSYLPLDSKISNQTMVDVINSPSVTGSIDRYLNLIARNPSAAEIAVIDNEFKKYTGDGNQSTEKLLATLKSVVAQYGSNANYSVAPAILVDSYPTVNDPEHSVVLTNKLAMPTIDSVSDSGVIQAIHAPVELRINVESFDKNGKKSEASVATSNIQLAIKRVAPAGPTDPGEISIGEM